MATLKTQIQIRRDTAANLANVVLKAGEPGYATDTKKLAIGDGSTKFSALKGRIIGPNASTDNALAKFDGTSGQVIQNSNATLSDAGQLKVVNWKDERYASNVASSRWTTTAKEIIIYTKIKFVSSAVMPIVRLHGYAYGQNAPIELKIGFYIYNSAYTNMGAVSMGAWRPEIRLFKYTASDSVDYVAIGFIGTCYYGGFQVDVQAAALGTLDSNILTTGWSVSTFTTTGNVPAVGTDKSAKVPYKSTLANLTINGTTYNGSSDVTFNLAEADHNHDDDYLKAEADTLQTVTDRGATTTKAITTAGLTTTSGYVNITGTSGFSEGIRLHPVGNLSSIWWNATADKEYCTNGMWGITAYDYGYSDSAKKNTFRFRGPTSQTATSPTDQMWISGTGLVTSRGGFAKSGSSDSYILLAGGGTKAVSDFQASGDYVVGPASATDNAITRYNGTTGKLVQNSSATLDDSGNLKIAGNFYVPAQKYAYFGTSKLATFRANDNGAFIVGAYDDIYFRGNLDSNDSAQAVGVQLSKTYLKPEITNTIALGASDKVWSNVYSGQLTSTVTTGTAPLVVASTTAVTNLNADMLDGKHASSFQAAGNYVTIDTAQTITGDKTFTGSVITTNNKFEIKANSNTDDSWIKLTNKSDAGYYAFGIRRPYDTYGLQLKIHPASGTDTYYDIWHAGNDGSGSGLDADLLDGKHASAFALTGDIPVDYIKITLSGDSGTLTAEQHAAMLANPHKVVFNRGSIWYYAENLGSTYFYTSQNVVYSGSKIQKHVLGINPNSNNRTWTYTLYEYDPGVSDGKLTIQKNGTTVATFTANQSGNTTANITVPTKVSDLNNDSGFLTSETDTLQTVTNRGNSTTNIIKIQNGDAGGSFVLGANVNSTTLTANNRKLGRMGVPSYDSTTKTVAGISFDSQQNVNLVDFGGHPNNAQSIAPDVIRFVVANSHNNAADGARTLALQISKQNGLVDSAGGGTSVAAAKFFIPVQTTSSITSNEGFIHGGLTAATGKTKNDYVLLAGGNTKPISDFALDSEIPDVSDFVTKSTAQTISGKKTFSGGLAITSADQNTNMIYFLGIDAFASGGAVKWTNKSDIKLPYSQITGTPTIPTVNNGTLTIQRNGTTVATFTANQAGNTTANITDNDTLNTAGSTNDEAKLYLVGAKSQAASAQTYSDAQVYTQAGELNATSVCVAEHGQIRYDATNECIRFVIA